MCVKFNLMSPCNCCCCNGYCWNCYAPRHSSTPPNILYPPPNRPPFTNDPIIMPPFQTTTLKLFLKSNCWNLTIPEKDPKTKTPKIISFPELETFENSFFKVSNNGILMKVPTNGFTTPNSKYPRCEFRELTQDGKKASWSTTRGEHLMTVETIVSKVPKNKSQICLAQIHDAEDDICMVRFEKGKMILSGRGFEKIGLGEAAIDEKISIIMEVKNSYITVTCNGKTSPSYKIPAEGCYFKAGNYLQSNETFDKNDEGEILLKNLSISHRE